MKKFVLCSTFSGRCISNLSYDRRNKKYNFELTYDMYKIRYWNSRSHDRSYPLWLVFLS